MDHGLELAKGLVRSVVRAFYDQREIIVVECIVIHHAYVPRSLFPFVLIRWHLSL